MPPLPSHLAEVMLGSLFIAIGVTAAAAGLSARPRPERAAAWFGVFCVLYGVRLAAKSALLQTFVPWPLSTFQYIDAFVTYAILVPGGLFVESLVGAGWHALIRRTWQLTCVYALAAALNDLLRGQPYASMWLNPPAVLMTFAVLGTHLAFLARRGRWTREVRLVAIAAAILTCVAIYETVAERGVFGENFDAEPFAMLFFAAALGWFVLTAARERAYEFVALSRELQLARHIQQSLLPSRMPDVPGLRVEGAYLPMSAVAGDFYDIATLPDSRVIVIVADVSGHGVPAALVASMMKVAFAAESERYDRPGDILGGINRALTGKFERAYVTACCAVIDPAAGKLAYAAAGHPPALLRRKNGRIERLHEGGIVLTLMPAATYDTAEVTFEFGDYLLLYTDGLIEASRSGGEEFFGDAELDRVISALPQSADLVQALLQAHRRWIGPDAPLADDVTLVGVARST